MRASGPAEVFANGTPYQPLTLDGGVTTAIVLQYAAPTPLGPDDSSILSATLFDLTHKVVARSVPLSKVAGVGNEPACALVVRPAELSQYQSAIQGPLATATPFKYILFGLGSGGSGVSGFIDDPTAQSGSTVVGHDMLPGVNVVGAVDFANTPQVGSPAAFTEYFSGGGPAEFLFDPAGNPLAPPQITPKPDFVAPDGATTNVPKFTNAPGSSGFHGTSAAAPNAAAVAAPMLQRNPTLTPAQVSAVLKESASDLGLPVEQQGAGLIDAFQAVELACYAAGTRLMTPRGYAPIERLACGDLLLTCDKKPARIRWVGFRDVDCASHPRPGSVLPIRIVANAFGDGRPIRPLLLSPDHAVFVGGLLIPIRYLVNGTGVRQHACSRVTYFHVELEHHDIVLAEGLPAETYLDTGNRAAFANGGSHVQLHPDFERASRVWEAEGFAPLTVTGEGVDAVRRMLATQAVYLNGKPLPRKHRRSADISL